MLRRTILALSVFALVATACGGDDDDAADDGPTVEDSPADSDTEEAADDSDTGSSDPDQRACGLLTADDVASATGVEVTEGPTQNELAPSDECSFELGDGSRVSVVYYTEAEATALGPDLYEGSEPIEGVGNEAWHATSISTSQARVDDGVISVQIVGGADDVTVELLTAAAG